MFLDAKHREQLVSSAILQIELQHFDVGGTVVASCGDRDVFKMQAHHVAFMFAKLLELRLDIGSFEFIFSSAMSVLSFRPTA